MFACKTQAKSACLLAKHELNRHVWILILMQALVNNMYTEEWKLYDLGVERSRTGKTTPKHLF